MIFILGWATVIVLAIFVLAAGLPETIRNIDDEILEKHRQKDKERAVKKAVKEGRHLRRVK